MDFHVQQALTAYKQPGSRPQGIASDRAGFAAEIAESLAANDSPLYESDERIEQSLKLDILGGVPSELYNAVTEALLYVYRANKKAQELLKHAEHIYAQRTLHGSSGNDSATDAAGSIG